MTNIDIQAKFDRQTLQVGPEGAPPRRGASLAIAGAGMAGLLAANLLRRHRPEVFERQLDLPHNHSALLRFRSPAVSDATGIPFRRVLIRKGIWDGKRVVDRCSIPLANAYSQKV